MSHSVSSLKSTVAGVFTPQKSENDTNQAIFTSKSQYQSTIAMHSAGGVI